jgi:hypothetical protein
MLSGLHCRADFGARPIARCRAWQGEGRRGPDLGVVREVAGAPVRVEHAGQLQHGQPLVELLGAVDEVVGDREADRAHAGDAEEEARHHRRGGVLRRDEPGDVRGREELQGDVAAQDPLVARVAGEGRELGLRGPRRWVTRALARGCGECDACSCGCEEGGPIARRGGRQCAREGRKRGAIRVPGLG